MKFSYCLLLLSIFSTVLFAQASKPFPDIENPSFLDQELFKKHSIDYVITEVIQIEEDTDIAAFKNLKDIQNGEILREEATDVLGVKKKHKSRLKMGIFYGLNKEGKLIYVKPHLEDFSFAWRNPKMPKVGRYYTYDKQGRFSENRSYALNEAQKIECYAHFIYNYDKNGNIISRIPKVGAYANGYFKYDDKNRLLEHWTQYSGSSKKNDGKSYTYNDKERTIESSNMTFPTGITIDHYNDQNQLIKSTYQEYHQRSDCGYSYVNTLKYNAAGKLVELLEETRANSCQTTTTKTIYIYNKEGFLCGELKTAAPSKFSLYGQYIKTYRYYALDDN